MRRNENTDRHGKIRIFEEQLSFHLIHRDWYLSHTSIALAHRVRPLLARDCALGMIQILREPMRSRMRLAVLISSSGFVEGSAYVAQMTSGFDPLSLAPTF